MPKSGKKYLERGTFLNVDVLVTATRPMKALANELERVASVLYHGKAGHGHILTFETAKYFGEKNSPDRVIADLCQTIGRLPLAAVREWRAARSRVFDVGFEAEKAPAKSIDILQGQISGKSLQKICDLGGSLAITCYQER